MVLCYSTVVYAEVETRIGALRSLLMEKLLQTPSTLHDQKRYIRSLYIIIILRQPFRTICPYSTQSSCSCLYTSHTLFCFYIMCSSSITYLFPYSAVFICLSCLYMCHTISAICRQSVNIKYKL